MADNIVTQIQVGSTIYDIQDAGAREAIANLPTPMVFKGTVGTGGSVTWANLPAAAATNAGFTYKVITVHSTTPVCKVGDTIVSNGSEWVVIPSGDEPDGTVTNVNGAAASGSHVTVTGGPITSSGTLTIGVESGYSIPSNTNQTSWTNKQEALTTSSVSDGTLNKVIGFNSNGTLVKSDAATPIKITDLRP